jgi:hypothetical protein
MAKMMFCPNCGQPGKPRRIVPGSVLITLLLLMFWLVPGLIYMIWRHKAAYLVCPSCRARNMVPLDSPNAVQGRGAAGSPGPTSVSG